MAYVRSRMGTTFSAHAPTLLRLLLIMTCRNLPRIGGVRKVSDTIIIMCARVCVRSFVAVIAAHALNHHSDLIIWHGERGKTKNAKQTKNDKSAHKRKRSTKYIEQLSMCARLFVAHRTGRGGCDKERGGAWMCWLRSTEE